RLIHRHRIHLPSELFLLAKVLVGVEGLGRQLDPSFNVVEVAAPFVRRLMTRRLAPSRVGRRVWEDLSHTAALWGRLPQELAGLATQARQGRLRLQVDPRGLDAHARRIERAVRELGVSVVFAATLLALVFSLWVAPGPHLAGVPLLTWFLLALLAFLGALLFISLFRRQAQEGGAGPWRSRVGAGRGWRPWDPASGQPVREARGCRTSPEE